MKTIGIVVFLSFVVMEGSAQIGDLLYSVPYEIMGTVHTADFDGITKLISMTHSTETCLQ